MVKNKINLNKSREIDNENAFIFNTSLLTNDGWKTVLVLVGLYLNNND